MAPEFPAGAKAHAFFSAKVTESNILEALRAEVLELAEGRTDLASARMRLKTFLGRQGIPADDVGMMDKPPAGVTEEAWREHRKVTNLGSTRRLDLILTQQAGMAHAVGRREVSMHPAVLERWPYFRYLAVMDGNEREDHGRYNDLVLPKTDPFWHTHTPPWDYNCRCDIEDADGDEARDLGGVGQTTESGKVMNRANGQVMEPTENETGFTFDIEAAFSADSADYDWDTIHDAALRDAARSEMETMER